MQQNCAAEHVGTGDGGLEPNAGSNILSGGGRSGSRSGSGDVEVVKHGSCVGKEGETPKQGGVSKTVVPSHPPDEESGGSGVVRGAPAVDLAELPGRAGLGLRDDASDHSLAREGVARGEAGGRDDGSWGDGGKGAGRVQGGQVGGAEVVRRPSSKSVQQKVPQKMLQKRAASGWVDEDDI